MLNLNTVPSHSRSTEAHLFHSIKSSARLQVTVPAEVRQKLDAALDEFFPKSTEMVLQGRIFYRVRIHDFGQDDPLEAKDMVAPPPDKASWGRVQIAGNPVLYTASEIETAIAEVRPAVDSILTIAEFSPKTGEEIRIFNLTQRERPEATKNPNEYTARILSLSKAMRFSEREFSRQVHPNDPDKYLDTVYIAQVIREKGFDGIAYKSLLNKDGVNYAFFSPDRLACKTPTTRRKVTTVKIESESL